MLDLLVEVFRVASIMEVERVCKRVLFIAVDIRKLITYLEMALFDFPKNSDKSAHLAPSV